MLNNFGGLHGGLTVSATTVGLIPTRENELLILSRSGNKTNHGIEYHYSTQCVNNCAILWELSVLTLGSLCPSLLFARYNMGIVGQNHCTFIKITNKISKK